MKPIRTVLFGTLAFAALPAVQAKVYTCIVNGEVVYTASPKGNCQQAQLQPIGSYSNNNAAYRNATPKATAPARTPSVSSRPRSNTAAAPAAAANTAAATPKGGDSTRRNILEQELANERNALSAAQKALTDGRAMKAADKNQYAQYQERVRQLESAVLDRQQNVQALQRELSRM
jgi:hypothetical protein